MNLQKGTQVVLRTAVPAAAGVLPPGTVAQVVATPIAPDVSYRLRFVDGHEDTVHRSEFDLPAQVKADDLSGLPPGVSRRGLRAHAIYQCVIGSRAYGLDMEDSDTDRRGIYQAPTDLVLSLYEPPAQLEDSAAQECFWELR